MRRIFKKNQIIITALALMIAVAGYINYSDHVSKKAKKETAKEIKQEDETVNNDIEPGQMVFANGNNSQYIITAKLDREQRRASGKEQLLEIVNNEKLSETEKSAAVTKLAEFAEMAEREAAAELLLEAKGFTNAIVTITGKKVDVVIEKDELTNTDLAQIEDIVTRKTECAISNLTITKVIAKS